MNQIYANYINYKTRYFKDKNFIINTEKPYIIVEDTDPLLENLREYFPRYVSLKWKNASMDYSVENFFANSDNIVGLKIDAIAYILTQN